MINTRVSIVLLTVGPRRSGCCLFDPFAPPHLTNDSGAPVTSDTDGNLLSARVNGTLLGAVTWDARNRLLTAGNVTYTYDAENRRINSTKSAQTTSYIWSRGGLDRLLVKTNPDGSITRYIHRLGLIYEETSPSGGGTAAPSFYHYNWQGSTVALSNAAGNVTARISYSPYGERTIESGTVTTPFLFNGQFGVMTEPNGLYCMMARFYSPIFRRFLSEDPAGFSGGINLFAYASGDPVNLIDPFGLGPVSSYTPDWWYRLLVAQNTFQVANLLKSRQAYIEDVSLAYNVDGNLIRAIILHESRGTNDYLRDLEDQLSWIKSGGDGSYGYAQLGPDARNAVYIEIDDAQTVDGSIFGAANWLDHSRSQLIDYGIPNPTSAQIAAQYNSSVQLGDVGSYGKQVNWTYEQIKSGKVGDFNK